MTAPPAARGCVLPFCERHLIAARCCSVREESHRIPLSPSFAALHLLGRERRGDSAGKGPASTDVEPGELPLPPPPGMGPPHGDGGYHPSG